MSDLAHGRIALRDLDGNTQAPGLLAPGTVAPGTVAPGTVAPGVQVTLHFSLALAGGKQDGEVIDSNFDKAPVTFTIGDGNLLPGFERAMLGLAAGERREITLEASEAFGGVNEDNVQRFPIYNFPPDLALDTGVMVEFADAAGNKQAGMVRSVGKQWVEVDFNHPLAGRAIRFSVHVHDVAQLVAQQGSQEPGQVAGKVKTS